jgi:transposase InsO family protein
LTHEERFVDLPPAQVWAQLLDAGQMPPCSIRTMDRVLAANAEVRERRNQLRHPAYRKPELLATGPNQVWSWDITKLLGPVKWTGEPPGSRRSGRPPSRGGQPACFNSRSEGRINALPQNPAAC